MPIVFLRALSLGLLLMSACAFAEAPSLSRIGMAASVGSGESGITPYRMAVLWDFGPLWLKENSWGVHGFWEASAAYWDGELQLRKEGVDDAMSVYTTGPQVRYMRKYPLRNQYWPYLEMGVGGSWFSKTELGDKRFSLHFQFEDRIGGGFIFGRNQEYDFNWRLIHYSNASLGDSNSGVNMVLVTIGRWF
jgi:lipid A 3-O-deacylase